MAAAFTNALNSALHTLEAPAQWLTARVGLSESLSYWQMSIGLFFALVLGTAGLLMIYVWLANRGWLYLWTALFLLFLAPLGAYSALAWSAAWLYLLLFGLIGADLIWHFSYGPAITPLARRILSRWLVVAILLTVGIPGVAGYHQKLVDQKNDKLLADSLQELDNQIRQLQSADLNVLTDLQKDAHISELVTNTTPELTTYLQSLMVENKLQILMVTNARGEVLARAQLANLTNDNILDALPWLKPAFAGENVAGVAMTERNQPAILTAVRLNGAGDTHPGILIGGNFLDQSYTMKVAQEKKWSVGVLASPGRYLQYSTSSTNEGRVLNNKALVLKVIDTGKAASIVANFSDRRIIVRSHPMDTLTPQNQVWLLRATTDDSALSRLRADVMLVILCVAVLAAASLAGGKLLKARAGRKV